MSSSKEKSRLYIVKEEVPMQGLVGDEGIRQRIREQAVKNWTAPRRVFPCFPIWPRGVPIWTRRRLGPNARLQVGHATLA